MKTETILKRCKDLKITKNIETGRTYDPFNGSKEYTSIQYSIEGPHNMCKFWDQEGKAVSVYAHRIGAKDDISSDYFCGWFPKTYKELVVYLNKRLQ